MVGKRKVTFDKILEAEKQIEKTEDIPNVTNKLLSLPIHLPLNLIGMFYYGLTTNVQSIMTQGLATLILLQLGYDYLIYQSVKDSKPKKKKKNGDNLLLLLFSSVLVPVLLAFPIFIIIILMGAPLASHLPETFILATHLSIIVINPVVMLFKFDYTKFLKIFKILSYSIIKNNLILLSVSVSIVSTWCGVIPIPLDWDRPWQNWPITLLVGSYLGYFLGSFLSLIISLLGL